MVLGISLGITSFYRKWLGQSKNHSLNIFASFCENPSLKDLNQLHASGHLTPKSQSSINLKESHA